MTNEVKSQTSFGVKVLIAAAPGVLIGMMGVANYGHGGESLKDSPLPEPKVLFSTNLKTLKGFEDCTFSQVLVFTTPQMGPVMNVIRCPGVPAISSTDIPQEHPIVSVTNSD
jgi:hypothetical protein